MMTRAVNILLVEKLGKITKYAFDSSEIFAPSSFCVLRLRVASRIMTKATLASVKPPLTRGLTD
jgi:hypothetical protein